MPELPEVETIARSLIAGQNGSGGLVGHTIARARVGWKRTIATPSAQTFLRRIRAQEVKGVGRRGKFIKIDLSKDTLLIHLRMSGDLLLGNSAKPLGSHSRLELYFEDDFQLSFNDPRKFGRVWLVGDAADVTGGLGPEPLDLTLTSKAFHSMLTSRNRQLKPLLLDQTFLAGLGNIYADEALWAARLHPLAASSSLDARQSGKLLKSIRKVLEEGIARNGASIDWVYRGGDFQNHFNAYQRTDEPCLRCGRPIRRILVGQRSTHYCPQCQVLS